MPAILKGYFRSGLGPRRCLPNAAGRRHHPPGLTNIKEGLGGDDLRIHRGGLSGWCCAIRSARPSSAARPAVRTAGSETTSSRSTTSDRREPRQKRRVSRARGARIRAPSEPRSAAYNAAGGAAMADIRPPVAGLAAILAGRCRRLFALMAPTRRGTLARLKSACGSGSLTRRSRRIMGVSSKTTGDGLLVEFAQASSTRCAARPSGQAAMSGCGHIEWRIGVNPGRHHQSTRATSMATASTSPRGSKPMAEPGGHLRLARGPDPDARKIRFPGRGSRRPGPQETSPSPCMLFRVRREAPTPTSPACGEGGRRRDPLSNPPPQAGEGRVGAAGTGSGLAIARQPSIAVLAVPEHVGRPRAGIFRRRHGRGDSSPRSPLPLAVRDRPQFDLHLQGARRPT